MSMLNRRLQVLLDDARHERLEREARRRQVSVASLVREAIDRSFPVTSERKREAAARLLGAEPMEVGDPDQLRSELEALRDRRA